MTTVAAIGIPLGALGLLCKPAGLLMQTVKMPGPANPVLEAMKNDPVILGWSVIAGITGTLLSLLLLMSAIGCLALKPWARTGMLAYSALALLMTVVSQAVGYLVIGPVVQNAVRGAGMPQAAGPAWLQGPVGLVIGVAIGLWYPLLVLYFFTRPRAREAFRQGLPGTGI